MIVGAPEDENVFQYRAGIERPGAVYRCQTETPFGCEQIPFDTSGKTKTKRFLKSQKRGCFFAKVLRVNKALYMS